MKDRRLAIALAAAGALLLSLIVTGPDLWLWRQVDHGAPPIRALTLGDQDYYILRLRAAVLRNGPGGSPFFSEHADDAPRFVLFETLVGAAARPLGPLIGTNPVVWANLLRALAVTALFLELWYALRRYAKLSTFASVALALSACLWQEPFAMQVQYALGSWLLPLIFGGFLLAASGFATERRLGRLARLLIASLLFAVHPVALAAGALAVGLAWLARLRERRDAATFVDAVAWSLSTLAHGIFLYAPFAFPSDTATAAETLARNAAIATHLPVMPLALAHGAGMLALVALCRRSAEGRARAWWTLLLAWCLATCIGQNLNLLTGKYFLGDHFLFMERLLAVAAGASVFALPRRAPSRGEVTVAALAAASLGAYGLGWLAAHPLRSWLLAGSLAPYFLGNAALAWHALGRRPALPSLKPRTTHLLLLTLVTLSAAYAVLFLWRLNRGYVPAHLAAQEARPLLVALDRLPDGVALANPELSGLIAMHARQRPYWSPIAFIDEAQNAELERRWRDALIAFPQDARLSGEAAKSGLYGNENLFCASLAERRLYAPLRERGWIAESLCRTPIDEAAWKEKEATARAAGTSGWTPGYRLDYLILDARAGETLRSGLETVFVPLTVAGPFTVYRYRP